MNSKTNKGFIPVIIILVVLLGIGGVYYFQSNKDTQSLRPTPLASIVATMVSDSATENWKVFKDEAFTNKDSVYNAYKIKYPENCLKRDYKILDCKLTNGNAVIVLNAGGHGGGDDEINVLAGNITKKYNAGEGKLTELEIINKKEVIGTFWFNKTDKVEYYSVWGLEFYGVPKSDLEEFNILLEKMLNSVEFIE